MYKRKNKDNVFSMSKQAIFFGTNNANKLSEIQHILGEKFEIHSYKDFPPFDVEETETTMEGNAALKAKGFFEHTGLPCFSDDSGLEVHVLNGEPGVYSARYAGEPSNSTANIVKLLHNLKGKTDREAQFRTVIAYYDGKKMHFFEGIVKGQIIDTPRGTNGFGYDPIFIPDGFDQTFAEMDSGAKHAISHRGIAVRKFADFLKHCRD